MNVRFGTSLVIVVVACLAVASGCTNSDFIQPGNGSIDIVISGTNADSHWTDGPTDQAIITLDDIRVRPNDPQADAALGSNTFLLGTEQDPEINFAATDSNAVGPVVLSSGSFRLQSFTITRIRFIDNGTPPGGATCKDAASRLVIGNSIQITPNQLGMTPEFDVTLDNLGRFEIQFDVDALLDVVVANATNCTPPSCSCSSVNANAVGAMSSTFLSFP